ncbi:MAG: hypothetical protein AABW50_04545 [Nanoarchaeota archaeon]
MTNDSNSSFLRKLALYFGGFFDIILLFGMFLFGLVGKRIPFWMPVLLLVSFYFTSWGWKGIKNN